MNRRQRRANNGHDGGEIAQPARAKFPLRDRRAQETLQMKDFRKFTGVRGACLLSVCVKDEKSIIGFIIKPGILTGRVYAQGCLFQFKVNFLAEPRL